SLPREPIASRGAQILRAVTLQAAPPEVVSQDDNDVGQVGWCRGEPIDAPRQQYQQERERFHQAFHGSLLHFLRQAFRRRVPGSDLRRFLLHAQALAVAAPAATTLAYLMKKRESL